MNLRSVDKIVLFDLNYKFFRAPQILIAIDSKIAELRTVRHCRFALPPCSAFPEANLVCIAMVGDNETPTRVVDPQDAIVRRPISNTIDDRIGIQIAYSKVVFRLL